MPDVFLPCLNKGDDDDDIPPSQGLFSTLYLSPQMGGGGREEKRLASRLRAISLFLENPWGRTQNK